MKEKLIAVFKKIQERNPSVLLSGSLALSLQGINIPREPHDLDIYVPYGVTLDLPDWLKFENVEGNLEYDDSEFVRTQMTYKDVSVDFFIPQLINSFKPVKTVTYGSILDGDDLKMLRFDDIVAFKTKHALDSSISANKHREDVKFILEKNQLKHF